MRISSSMALMFIVFASLATAAPRYNYPEVNWYTAETEHFVIHYHEGVEWTASKVASVAEQAYAFVTKLYEHQPKKKTHIIVRDLEDHANGFAVWHLDWITIWATNSTFPLRGQHDWIYGTLVHEFAHVVSLQKSASFGKLIEGIRLGGLEDEDTKANIDAGGSVLIAANTVPRWWAEAIAQHDTAAMGHDLWDTNQDMLLRMATLEENLLTYDELHNIRVRRHFGPELVYNQGFDFVSYLSKRFGSDINRRLAENQRKRKHLDFEKNFKEVFGISERQLYSGWQATISKRYNAQVAAIRDNAIVGKRIKLIDQKKLDEIRDPKKRNYKDGLFNSYPRYSPDGHFFSYANQGSVIIKYLDKPYDITQIEGSGTGTLKTLPPAETTDDNAKQRWSEQTETGGKPATPKENTPLQWGVTLKGRGYTWSPTGDRLIITRRRPELTGAYPTSNLYLVDLSRIASLTKEYRMASAKLNDTDEKAKLIQSYANKLRRIKPKAERLSKRLRATRPAWSPDGKNIAYSKNRDGKRSIEIVAIEDKSLSKPLTVIDHGDGSQCLDANWSPDGQEIAYSLLVDRGRHSQLRIYDLANGKSTAVIDDPESTYQYPTWSADGKSLYFSSDRNNGITQIFRLNLKTRRLTQITNVMGGAFQAFVTPDEGELLYSFFTSFGFKLNRLPMQGLKPAASVALKKKPRIDTNKTLTSYTPLEKKPYFLSLRPPRIFPTFVFEDRQPKGGISMQLSDYLEKHNLSAAGLFGSEQDYTVSYRNRSWYIDLFASYTKFVRSNQDTILISDNDNVDDEPRTLQRFDINFLTVALIEEFAPSSFFSGDHTLSLSYNRRWVISQIGIPFLLDATTNDVGTSFEQISNHNVTLEWEYQYFKDRFNPQNDVNPRNGRQIRLAYAHIWTDLFTQDTSLNPPTANYDFNRVVLNYTEYLAIPKREQQTLELRLIGGYIDRDVNINDEFFAGGRLNFRAFGDISDNSTFYGYEDFSISGETLVLLSATYRFPLLVDIAKKRGVIYLDSLYGGLIFETGNAWDFNETKNCAQNPTGVAGNCSDGNTLLTDVGAEVRMKAFLFNDFNEWNSVFRVAYGFQDNAANGFQDDDLPVRFYLGLGTDF